MQYAHLRSHRSVSDTRKSVATRPIRVCQHQLSVRPPYQQVTRLPRGAQKTVRGSFPWASSRALCSGMLWLSGFRAVTVFTVLAAAALMIRRTRRMPRAGST